MYLVNKFRAYDSWADCIMDRARFLKASQRYAAWFRETTGKGWARAAATAGYATDPQYMKKLIDAVRGWRDGPV